MSLTIKPGAMQSLEGFPRMLRRETLHIHTTLWTQCHINIFTQHYSEDSRKLSSDGAYLAGVLVYSNVDDAIVVAALLQDGLMDGQIPVLANLPEKKHINSNSAGL